MTIVALGSTTCNIDAGTAVSMETPTKGGRSIPAILGINEPSPVFSISYNQYRGFALGNPYSTSPLSPSDQRTAHLAFYPTNTSETCAGP